MSVFLHLALVGGQTYNFTIKRIILALVVSVIFFFFQAEDGIRDIGVTGVQTCALPISDRRLDAEGKQLDVMLEVKLSPEESKAGADPEGLDELVAAVRACPNLNLAGQIGRASCRERV